MAKKTLTLIVVPDHTAEVRRFQIDKSLLRHGAIGLGAAVLVLLIGVAPMWSIRSRMLFSWVRRVRFSSRSTRFSEASRTRVK